MQVGQLQGDFFAAFLHRRRSPPIPFVELVETADRPVAPLIRTGRTLPGIAEASAASAARPLLRAKRQMAARGEAVVRLIGC